MYEKYDDSVLKANQFLTNNIKSCRYIRSLLNGSQKFRSYMQNNNLAYSKGIVLKWLSLYKDDWPLYLYRQYRQCLYLIDDIFTTGQATKLRFSYEDNLPQNKLSPFLKLLFIEFKRYELTKCTVATWLGYKSGILLFLRYCHQNDICHYNQFTHQLIRNFKKSEPDNCKGHDAWVSVRKFLKFLKEKKYTYLTLDLPINQYYSNNLLYLNEISPKDRIPFNKYHTNSKKLLRTDLDKINLAIEIGKDFFVKNEYCHYSFEIFIHDTITFKLFLEINSLFFSDNLIHIWLDYFSNSLRLKSYDVKRRNLLILSTIMKGKLITRLPMICNKKRSIFTIPEWSKPLLDQFLQYLKGKSLNPATIIEYKSVCRNFLDYLERIELQQIQDLTPQIIKDFQLQEIHKNPKSKNCYSYRVRSFLAFLGDNNYIPIYYQQVISCDCAPHESLVHILSNKQITSINEYKKNITPTGILDNALISLGLQMGFRRCDVLNLKFENISLLKNEISIMQQKTGIQLTLPIPNEVMTFLLKYMNEIRPESKDSYVFITNQVPYSKLSTISCQNALARAVVSSGEKATFHDLRRTFASKLANSNISSSIIADILGQSDQSNLDKYLSLNSEKMRYCAINLNGIEYKGALF